MEHQEELRDNLIDIVQGYVDMRPGNKEFYLGIIEEIKRADMQELQSLGRQIDDWIDW